MMDLLGQTSLHGGAGAGTKRRILSSFLPSVPNIVNQHSAAAAPAGMQTEFGMTLNWCW